MEDTLQNLRFISSCFREWEGRILTGYIPCNVKAEAQSRLGRKSCNVTGNPVVGNADDFTVMGVSGVTIGTGVDLGQQTAGGLGGMGVPQALIRRFGPYLGRQGDKAIRALYAAPFSISEAECDALDAAVHAHYVRRIAHLYDGASTIAFAHIPKEAQAVTAHLFYHLGTPQKYPNTWAALTCQDWPVAAAKLKNGALWKGPYDYGRASEGRLLETIAGDAS